jgi:PAS domain S-box-containing protein
MVLKNVIKDIASQRAPGVANRPRTRLAVGLLCLVCLSMIGLQVWREWVAYDIQVRETSTSLSNLATSLVRQADDTFEIADTALLGIVQQLDNGGMSGPALAHLDTTLKARAVGFPRFRDIVVLGKDGNWLASSLKKQGTNLAYRTYFQHHRSALDEGPFIGPPIKSIVTGQWILTVSRGIRDADGQFAGVVLAVIDQPYFVKQYAAYNLGRDATVSLLRTDGILLARNPPDEMAIGANLSSGAVFQKLRESPVGDYRTKALTDGVQRVSGYSRSTHFPILMVAAISDEQALSDWGADAITHMGIVLGLMVIIGLLVMHLLRQTGRAYVAQVSSRESEASFRLLAEHASDMISRFGRDGTRLYVSPAVQSIFGVRPQDVGGRNLLDLVHPEDVDAVAAFQNRLRQATVLSDSIVFRVQHPDRGEVWVEANARSLVDPETMAPDGFVSVIRDVTDRHRLAAERERHMHELHKANIELDRLARHFAKARDVAERANRAKSRFLAGMSHELRTPLNGILGYAQLLGLEGGLNPKQTMRVDAMLTAGQHLLQMIHCVLDLSEIENERVELQIEPVTLRQIGDACLDLIRPAAETKGLSLAFAVEPDVPLSTMADPARLRQVLLNLLGNAVKFTHTGAVTLRLRMMDPATLVFEVADTGPGIPADQKHRLFQEFDRLDGADVKAIEGAGLGLSLAAGLAGLMDGRLVHQDNPGGGSLFWLEMPLRAVAGQAVAPGKAAEPAPTAGTARLLRVLVVDDVAMNRDIAAAFITSAGHKVVCAGGGAEAVTAAAEADFDIIMMDIRMPEVDGLEATRRIRALGGARARVPVIAMTAQAFSEQVEECREAGMTGHLAKPFTVDTILAALAQGVAPAQPMAAAVPEAKPPVVLDLAELNRTTAMLPAEAVEGHLRTIAEKAQALLDGLSEAGALHHTGIWLAAATHALAGSSGMFGFARLAATGFQFERAIRKDASAAEDLAEDLRQVLRATLREIEGQCLRVAG